ncbi:MAG: hypothetical protein ABR559_10310 [Gemmatimonadota bacterium]
MIETRHLIEEENGRLRRLGLLVDLALVHVGHDPRLTHREALDLIERCRDAAVRLFPDSAATFDLIYRPRFDRVLARRWPVS